MSKMAHIPTFFRASVAVLLTTTMAGCSYLPSPSLPWSEPALESNPSAEAIFKQGMDDLKSKRYTRAIDKFERIRDEFPFSTQVVEAELQIAEAHYLNKQYPEAALGFKDFLHLRPTNENIPFVIYRLGLVHFDQVTTIDRDQKNIEAAKGYFETLIKEHSNSPYTANAKEKLAKCREYLAEREFYVGSFYQNEKRYPAATERFEKILRLYRDTPTAVKALFQLGESYKLEKNTVKASLAYKALIQHYPDSPLAKNARIQLSQLDKEHPDPLAMLLMRDGRPVFNLPPESGQQKEKKEVTWVAKKEVVKEEGGVKRGFFRRIADTINPFSSSEEKDEEDKKKDDGKEEGGFLSGLWPFGEDKKEKGKILEPGDAQLVSRVDESLKEKGILNTQNSQAKGQDPKSAIENLDLRPPASDLPQVTEEAPSSDPAEVLTHIDERLEKGGNALGELPPPPEVSSKLFVTPTSTSKKKKSTAPSPSTIGIGLLDSIDKELKRKGIEAPQPEPIPTAQPKGDREKVETVTRQEKQEKIELTPRLTGEKSPLFDAGEYQLKEKTEEAEKERVERAPDKPPDAAKGLPAAVVQGPPSSTTKEKPAETTSADKGPEDEEKSGFDQIKEDLRSLRDVLNPFGW